jgi:hypothetical protein
MGKPTKKSSVSKSKRTAPQTTQVTRNYNQNISPRMGSTRYYGTRSYAGRQYSGTRYYSGTGYYGNNYYGGGTRYYYSGGSYPYYGYYSGWPYSNWGTGRPGDITRTPIGAVTRTVVTTTTTRTTRRGTVITDQWLQPCSGALANSVTITA